MFSPHPSKRPMIIATDFDGTVADDGVIGDRTLAAIKRFKAHGGTLLLVTGRDMQDICGLGRPVLSPAFALFDLIVAENGAVIWSPSAKQVLWRSPEMPEGWREQLISAFPTMFAGHSILSISATEADAVSAFMRTHHIHLHVAYNKGSMMLMMPGVDKGLGLKRAARLLHLRTGDITALGDGENDQPMLKVAGYGIAMANAVDVLKKHADHVTTAPAGQGFCEVVDQMVRRDLVRPVAVRAIA